MKIGKMKRLYKYSLISLVITLFVACGGGGAGGALVVDVDPQGLWKGTNSFSNSTVNVAVLENGQAWGIYSEGASILGAIYGTASTDGNRVTASGKTIDFVGNQSSLNMTLSGIVTAKSAMTLSAVGVTVPLTYQEFYDEAASLSAISGTWSFDHRLIRSGIVDTTLISSITIDNSGAFTAGVAPFCVFSGNVTPKDGGKNIYILTTSIVGTLCPGLSSMSGIVFIDKSVTPNKFFSLALSIDNADGIFAVGTKIN